MNKYSILVIDDEPEILEFLHRILSENYEVAVANNANEAKVILSRDTTHLIICDVMMPLVDGFEFCRWIKNDPNFAHIPVILLTAKNTTKDAIDGLESGADVYMQKPFSNKQLLAQVASTLSSRSKYMDHFVNEPFMGIK